MGSHSRSGLLRFYEPSQTQPTNLLRRLGKFCFELVGRTNETPHKTTQEACDRVVGGVFKVSPVALCCLRGSCGFNPPARQRAPEYGIPHDTKEASLRGNAGLSRIQADSWTLSEMGKSFLSLNNGCHRIRRTGGVIARTFIGGLSSVNQLRFNESYRRRTEAPEGGVIEAADSRQERTTLEHRFPDSGTPVLLQRPHTLKEQANR